MVYLFARKYAYCLYMDTFLVENIHIYYLFIVLQPLSGI